MNTSCTHSRVPGTFGFLAQISKKVLSADSLYLRPALKIYKTNNGFYSPETQDAPREKNETKKGNPIAFFFLLSTKIAEGILISIWT